jgi:hypothetical protein
MRTALAAAKQRISTEITAPTQSLHAASTVTNKRDKYEHVGIINRIS